MLCQGRTLQCCRQSQSRVLRPGYPAAAVRCRSRVRRAPAEDKTTQVQAVKQDIITAMGLQKDAFSIPKGRAVPVQAMFDAQAAAEAAQQEMLTTGPIAEEIARGNELLDSMCRTYATLQRLYHKAMRPFLLQHPEFVDSLAGEDKHHK